MIIPITAKMTLAENLRTATSPADRVELVRAYARAWSVDESTARRHAGVRLRQGPAATRGYPVAREILDRVAAAWLSSATERYPTATSALGDVIDGCESAGLLQPGQLSVSQLRRYLREQHLSLADQRRGRPHIHQRSEHPNHVHMADVTVCRQWYLKPDGRLDLQSFRRGSAAYRNKDLPATATALKRYVLVDHATGMVYVQYAMDETAVTLLTFLAGAWLPKRQRREVGPTSVERWWPAPFEPAGAEAWAALPLLRDYHFRGVPRVLVVDRGSANQAAVTAKVCERLGVELQIAQEARAKGTVEQMMWTWETKFEAWLAEQPAPDLATLNVWALDFLQRWCLRKVHTRHRMTRSQAWALIEPAQLRELPPWSIFQELATRDPEVRRVKSGESGQGLIRHEGRAWRVEGVELIGQDVQVWYSAFHADQLNVRTADGRILLATPITRDRWGFFASSPVIGERYARHPETVTEQARKRVEAVRAAAPPLEVFGRAGERGDTPALLPPRLGVEIAVTTDLGMREISRDQFNRRVRAHPRFNGRAFTEAEGLERNRRWDGQATLPESSVEDFVAWCEHQAVAASPKVVNLFR